MVVVKRDSMKKASEEATMPTPPDGGWGWVVVFASFMIHVVADGVTYTFGIFYYEFLKYYGESKGTTAWVASIMVGTTYCIGPIASGLTNRYGCRAVTIAGSILAAAGLMLSTLAPNVLTLYFTIGILTGAGLGLMYLPSIVSVTCYFEKQRAFATGIAVCGSGMGTFALAPLTEYLVEMYGWKGSMLIIAAMVLNCTVFGALFRPLEASCPRKKVLPVIKNPELPKLKLSNGTLSNGRLSVTEDGISPSTPLMFQANGHATTEGESKKHSEDTVSNDSRLTNGFINHSKSLDITPKMMLPPGYSTNPSTPLEANSVSKDNILRSNGCTHDKKTDSTLRNSLMLPTDFLRRKVEGTPLSSFVCSSASLAQTHKELSQLEYSCSQSHHGGLMYRKDIFYSGSLVSLAKYRSHPNISYSSVWDNSESESKRSRFKCCPKEMRDALGEMTNFSLLKNPVFLLFAVSNFLTSIGFNVPYIYTKDRVTDLNLTTAEEASFLLSIIGISNTIGRVTLGYLSDRSCVNRLWIYNVSLLICGLSTALSAYALDYSLMATYCATFGATAGAYVSLTSVILVDLLGLDKLTNAFGILLVFQGISSLIGPPITGWLYDFLGSYDPGFFMSGTMIAISGIMLFLVPCLQKPPTVHLPDPEDPKPKTAETSA
ncbi:Monocarboxylate transporter 12 like protein [Argiope bruennichi]|uniref:Monocarboxylate transporter 12 like protein n=1 Tax=Argiope bruennichi TaxID=94029 RepID=A0A8T0E8A9_ARGBR|nr:Monocarboxylate transporter 12 like protein [Argiope bruennichi]